jgi:hypothetical protein
MRIAMHARDIAGFLVMSASMSGMDCYSKEASSCSGCCQNFKAHPLFELG